MHKVRRGWILLAVGLAILTTLPYLVGFFQQGEARFTGFVFGVEDGNSYIAKMLRGAEGDWLFRTPYTNMPQTGFLAFLPYLLLGKLTSNPGQHVQLVVLFHLFRIVGIFALCFTLERVFSLFFPPGKIRWMGTALVTAGGGLGWLAPFGLQALWQERTPLEFYSPEAFGFLSVLGLPHLVWSRAFLFWGLYVLLKNEQEDVPLKDRLTAGGSWFMAGLMQPQSLIIGLGVVGLYGAGRLLLSRLTKWSWDLRRFLRTAVWMGLFAAPLVIYTGICFLMDPYLRVWGQQNLITSPPLSDFLLAYAPVIPLAIWGGWKVLRGRNGTGVFFLLWAAVFIPSAYLPYDLQRRLTEGGWAACVVLALLGYLHTSTRVQRAARVAAVTLFIPAVILLAGGGLAVGAVRPPVFRPGPETAMFLKIRQLLPKDAVILAEYDTSNALPAWTPQFTLIGHGPESAHLSELRPKVEAFLANPADAELDWLAAQRVTHVLFTPKDAGRAAAKKLPWLIELAEGEGYTLYSVEYSP